MKLGFYPKMAANGKELIQHDLTPENIADELKHILTNPKKQKALLEDYEELRSVLGNTGASNNAASIIVSDLKNK